MRRNNKRNKDFRQFNQDLRNIGCKRAFWREINTLDEDDRLDRNNISELVKYYRTSEVLMRSIRFRKSKAGQEYWMNKTFELKSREFNGL